MIEKEFLLSDLLNRSIAPLLNDCDILHINKSTLGRSEDAKKNHNLYGGARVCSSAKDLVTKLSNFGYYLVGHQDGVSKFFNYKNKNLYDEIFLKDKNCNRFGELYYSVEYPPIDVAPSRLLVVFSSVADFPYNANIERRCFYKNFPSISKYIPYDTAIVRISDVGGVVGSFYFNNNYNANIEGEVQSLLRELENITKIKKENTVLYGVSKGGTASLYHGLKGQYKFVAVDPIVSDIYHEVTYNDSHFTEGNFPESKQKKFDKISSDSYLANGYLLTSKNSPVFKYINEIYLPRGVDLINVEHNKIKDHPDVGPNTINVLMMLLNSLYYNFYLSSRRNIVHEF